METISSNIKNIKINKSEVYNNKKLDNTIKQNNIENISVKNVEEVSFETQENTEIIAIEDYDIPDYWKDKINESRNYWSEHKDELNNNSVFEIEKRTEYKSDGTPKTVKYYWGGTLLEEDTYGVGYLYLRRIYNEFGTYYTDSYYDKEGNLEILRNYFEHSANNTEKITYYDKEGNISNIREYERTDGNHSFVKKSTFFDKDKNMTKIVYYEVPDVWNKDKGMKTSLNYDVINNYDEKNYILKEVELKKPNADILDLDLDFFDLSDKRIAYGGNQGELGYSVNDPRAVGIIHKYFPNATVDDCIKYLSKMKNRGCGYTALVNTVFKEYQDREQEFYETFGFPMYEEVTNSFGETSIKVNYDYLIIDFFSWSHKGKSISSVYNKKDVGLSTTKEEKFESYLKERYNVECDVPTNKDILNSIGLTKNNCVERYKELAKDGYQVTISVEGCDLYEMVDVNGEYRDLYNGSPAVSDLEAHEMLITDISKNGNLIVSSWGKCYEVDLSNMGFMPKLYLTAVKYD